MQCQSMEFSCFSLMLTQSNSDSNDYPSALIEAQNMPVLSGTIPRSIAHLSNLRKYAQDVTLSIHPDGIRIGFQTHKTALVLVFALFVFHLVPIHR